MTTTSSGTQVFERAVQFQIDEGSWVGVEDEDPREAAQKLWHTYWQPLCCSDMPPSWALAAFDMAVNHANVPETVRMLKESVGLSSDGTLDRRLLTELAKKRDARYLGTFHSKRAQAVLLGCEASERTEKVRRVMECYALCRAGIR